MFQEQPGSGRVVSPVGTQIQLNCSVMDGYNARSWSVRFPESPDVVVDARAELELLRNRGITFRNLGTQMSQIIISGQLGNSQTTVRCVAANDTNAAVRCESEPVQVVIYGKLITLECYVQ